MKKNKFTTQFFIFSVFVFLVAQLIINSRVSPLGSQLQQLNIERDYLLEINENINEELAKLDSIVVVRELAQKRLNLENNTSLDTIYIQKDNVLAGR